MRIRIVPTEGTNVIQFQTNYARRLKMISDQLSKSKEQREKYLKSFPSEEDWKRKLPEGTYPSSRQLRKVRLDLGWKQSEVAKRIRSSASTVSNVENDKMARYWRRRSQSPAHRLRCLYEDHFVVFLDDGNTVIRPHGRRI